MKTKLIQTMSVAAIIFSGFSASLCVAQYLPIFSGCSEADYVQGETNVQIETIGRSYNPKCLKVKVGSTVTIQASQRHPLAAMPDINGVSNPFSDQELFITPQTRTMNTPGVFGYFCEAHGNSEGDGMAGVILVQE